MFINGKEYLLDDEELDFELTEEEIQAELDYPHYKKENYEYK